ncbi:MAG: hypothetical protein WC121_05005 [Candidatus Kapaibacterium sp.]
MLDFKIIAINELSKLAVNQELYTWLELLEFVCSLPYGRNENRHDLSLVLKEKKGTCSSKHAFLKAIALENNQDNVKLILGLYKMNIENTPRIGVELVKNSIDYLPEAHCYLKINDTRIDVTSANSNFEKIRDSLIKEIEIQPHQVSEYKVDYHKKFIEQWIKENGIKYSFNEIWAIREKCIKNIENSN